MVVAADNELRFPDLLRSHGVNGPGTSARQRTLALSAPFAELVPGGAVQRGSIVACSGAAPVSLAMGLAAGPSQQGAWTAVAGLPALGLAAASEAGVALERLVLVTEPAAERGGSGPAFTDQQWGDVLGAMIDGFDVIVLGPAAQRVRAGTARRLQSRLRSQGVLLVTVGHSDVFGCDLQLVATVPVWEGLGEGHGVAAARRVHVELLGRRMPRARHAELLLPAPDGTIALSDRAAASTTTALDEHVDELRNVG